jgi:hypothetical protein
MQAGKLFAGHGLPGSRSRPFHRFDYQASVEDFLEFHHAGLLTAAQSAVESLRGPHIFINANEGEAYQPIADGLLSC